MKFTSLMNGILIGLLLGCSQIDQDTTVRPTPEAKQSSEPTITETTEFDSVSFPQDSCGEKLPNDPEFYPVKFYPVFVDYRENYLQIVKAKYCRDAIKQTRKKTGRDAILVASFLSVERANQFKDFLKNNLGSGEVGEPTIIEAKPNQSVTFTYSKESIAKAAKLNSAQAQQLISINNNVKELETKAVVILPTYIPPGFRVDIFTISKQEHPDPIFTGPRYEIAYRNSSNACFIIGGGVISPSGDKPIEYNTVTEIYSPAFGKASFGSTDFDRDIGHGHLGFIDAGYRVFKGKNEYIFASPIELFHPSNCSRISIQEATKIVKSFQFIDR